MKAMQAILRHVLTIILCAGALVVTSKLPEANSLKAPLMSAALAALALLHLPRLVLSPFLLLFLAYTLCAYARVTPLAPVNGTSVLVLGAAFAFLLGYMRAPLAQHWAIPVMLAICVGRAVVDLATLSHIGSSDPNGAALPPGSVTSFFGSKHVFGLLLVLGAFQHFYLMEKGEPHKPVQVLLYSSTFIILLTLVLSDSRLAQGSFFICVLPMLFLSLRLDFKEPHPERIAWIMGLTLCLGLAWINLPERQLEKTAALFSPATPDNLLRRWSTAWRIFLAHPLFGSGLGSFRFAAAHIFKWRSFGSDEGDVSQPLHASNHFLESLAEGGAFMAVLETALIAMAMVAMAISYYRVWRVEAKYAFFALSALLLAGSFSPILDEAPLRFVYWGLIGYGCSLAVEFFGRGNAGVAGSAAARTRRITMAAGLILSALLGMHLSKRIAELKSDFVFMKTRTLPESDHESYTNLMVEVLRINPANEAANYGYARVLAHFNKEADALRLLDHVQTFAPDPILRAEAMSDLYMVLGRWDLAGMYASQVLERLPGHLASFEQLIQAMTMQRDCEGLDSLRVKAAGLENSYPLPGSSEYTIEALDSLFGANADINFVQRWFGGQALKKRFVERQLIAFNRSQENHERARKISQARCPDPSDSTSAPGRSPKKPEAPHRLYHKWRGIG